MQILSTLLSLSLSIALSCIATPQRARARAGDLATAAAKQLLAVRGEIVSVKSPGKAALMITVRPAKDFAEVTVLARENDLVGSAIARAGDTDLLGLLSDDSRDDETITAAELNVGDVVSIIYDPQIQNRALEIYLH
jgi:hypothetical protein